MKAAGSITQPAGDAVPIFADPAREYTYVSRVRRYRRLAGGARFFVVTNEDEEMVLDLRFVAPEVLRVRFHRPKEEPPLASPMLVEHFERPVDVSIRLRAGKIVLATAAVELHVVRSPFHFGLFDRRGGWFSSSRSRTWRRPAWFPFPWATHATGRGVSPSTRASS